jgi:hypothetical protein
MGMKHKYQSLFVHIQFCNTLLHSLDRIHNRLGYFQNTQSCKAQQSMARAGNLHIHLYWPQHTQICNTLMNMWGN